MSNAKDAGADGYNSFYREFDSDLMRQIRREAYGEDIGQHSWVSAEEMRADIRRLGLTSTSRFLDLGAGPCGPLTFVLATVGCSGTGAELSPQALRAGEARAMALGVERFLTVREIDLNERLPFEAGSFDAAMSLDVVLHLRDRARFFEEVARVLSPRGRFLFTDAGVVTGSISNDEVRKRSVHGLTHLVPPGWNETLLVSAGFRLIETEDRTASAAMNGGGRLAAVMAHRASLEQVMGADEVRSQLEYLEIVVDVARRRALSRMMYVAELDAPALT